MKKKGPFSFFFLLPSRFKPYLSFQAKKRRDTTTFMCMMDYGHVIYMRTSLLCFHAWDTVYNGALSFITKLETLFHSFLFFVQVKWSDMSELSVQSYFLAYITEKLLGSCCRHYPNIFFLATSTARTELGKRTFKHAALCLESAVTPAESEGADGRNIWLRLLWPAKTADDLFFSFYLL